MSFRVLLSDALATVAMVRQPARGRWSAELDLDEDRVFAVGDRVTLKVGELELEGAISRGDEYAFTARYGVVGGRGGWHKKVPKRSYSQPKSGVKLSTVLRDLALDCGEEWLDGFGPRFVDGSVGPMWFRRGGVASVRLAEVIGRAWHIDDDGKTVFGDREIAKARAEVLDFDPTLRRIKLDSDGVEKARPGQTLDVGSKTLTLETVIATTGKGGTRLEGWAA